jgi:alkylated DNA repair dioxygenase AlkB
MLPPATVLAMTASQPGVRHDATTERLLLDEHSWVDITRGWLVGADALYKHIVGHAAWSQGRIFRYERYVDEPRLGGWSPAGAEAIHPALNDAQRELQARYRTSYDGCALAWYRDGRDSVAFHRDRELRWLDDTVIAVVSLGAQRPFLVRPRANRYAHEAPNRGATHDLAPAGGDLLVMGGRCQADWEHSVPKVPRRIGGRVSLQWRWTSRRGRPQIGANYRAPRLYSR